MYLLQFYGLLLFMRTRLILPGFHQPGHMLESALLIRVDPPFTGLEADMAFADMPGETGMMAKRAR